MSETPPNQHQPQDPAQGPGGAAPGAPGPGTGGRPGFAPQSPQPPQGPPPQQQGHTPPGGGQAPHPGGGYPGAAPQPPYPQQQPQQGGAQGGPRMAPPGGPVPPGHGAPVPGAPGQGAPGQAVTGQMPAVGAAQGPAVPGFPGGGPGPAPSAEDPTWPMIAHLAGIVVACLGWLPALLVHASQKQRSAFARHHSSEALNFQLTLLFPYALAWIVYIVLAFLTPTVVWIGSVLIALVWGLSIVFGVLAAANANKGGWYRYPVAVRLVK